MNRSGGVKSNKVILFKIKCTLYTVGMEFYVRNTLFTLICLINAELLTTETQLQAFNHSVVHEVVAFYNNILAGTRSTEQQIHGICTRIVEIPIGITTHLVWSFVLRVEVSTVNITSNVSKTKRKKKRRKETISLNIVENMFLWWSLQYEQLTPVLVLEVQFFMFTDRTGSDLCSYAGRFTVYSVCTSHINTHATASKKYLLISYDLFLLFEYLLKY